MYFRFPTHILLRHLFSCRRCRSWSVVSDACLLLIAHNACDVDDATLGYRVHNEVLHSRVSGKPDRRARRMHTLFLPKCCDGMQHLVTNREAQASIRSLTTDIPILLNTGSLASSSDRFPLCIRVRYITYPEWSSEIHARRWAASSVFLDA